ncbi:hypothetical protein GPECTOR_77g35 [Gonium pectorale]|uniref:Uncharacterized protein n=1 Tax=Gonium pectorale TaxID=33097 RepID=A0A150G234_GONPE|nr:hypothetical protein GPECTOR_77g35 [Gonium pectorale]|eukprot:KXZ43939.1 hypothetical protein GPECTOR_77g35 [Gonium pectorale]
MTDFLQESAKNRELLAQLVKASKQDCTPEDFADFADANNSLQNADQSTDEALLRTAKRLKGAGAVRLLRQELPWQCSFIENAEDLLKCLSNTS